MFRATIPGIDHHFEPLEEAIRDKLIPSLIGRSVSEVERRILALPVRYGGMGIVNPTNSSKHYAASTKITENLSAMIFNQDEDFTNYNLDEVKSCIAEVKRERERRRVDEGIRKRYVITQK